MIKNKLLYTGDSNYSLPVGEKDKDRLIILNEIYSPSTEQFFTSCPILKGDKVLELGCGIGLITQMLASYVGETGYVLGIDNSEEQLAIANNLLPAEPIPQLEYKKLSVYDLEMLNEKFDVVYTRFLLVHLPDPLQVIELVKGILKPGGNFIIEDMTGHDTLLSIPNRKGMEIVQYFDKLQFQVHGLDDKYFATIPDLLKKAGYQIVLSQKKHPQLDTEHKRKMLSYNLSSLKRVLLSAGMITEEDYQLMYPIVKLFEKDMSVVVYTYELGQICATHSK